MTRLSSNQWLAGIAGLSLLAVLIALVLQHGFGMQPCPWCILQRVIFLAIALVALLALALTWLRPIRRLLAAGAMLLSALGAAAAIYQNVVAAKQVSCAMTLADRIIGALSLENLLPSVFGITASCADAAVDLLGLPFEFWSLGLFVVLFLAGGAALAAAAKRR